ncbi:phosphatidate cytidylyltransferase, mitochondrial isoform X1 [Rhinopithecus roxellana]|uniref:Phosphatidate cytidylyltransferase, mitochondrial n=1 Tax=Rhinopithecus roxellana TaxID=61622 RepID=A0A2K6PY36_RHIRO|nr:phosphatidate cytidylyltransferase, mitochondrial isoform X1 [Rhinopithecus roxellana]
MALQALQSSGVTFRKILSHFPEELSLAFVYGSGVYRQAGPSSDQKNAMLDFVFTVDDPVAWHSKNLKKNWRHYSFLKVLGPKIITSIQNNYGAGVYYNSLIMCDGRLIKYGVISTNILIEDLLNWNNLYIAGRLQKPVKIISMNEDVTLRAALDRNLKSAVTTAFLMLPESFSEEDLFIEIAGLSYSGDFRMVVGEDKTKVLNIVKPNIAHFRELYGSILQEDPQVVYKSQQGRLEIDKSPEGQFTQLMTLPKSLQQQIHHIMDSPGKNRDVEETLFQVAHDPDCGDVVRLGLSAIVRPSSIRQSTKGIFTAGKSFRNPCITYLLTKALSLLSACEMLSFDGHKLGYCSKVQTGMTAAESGGLMSDHWQCCWKLYYPSEFSKKLPVCRVFSSCCFIYQSYRRIGLQKQQHLCSLSSSPSLRQLLPSVLVGYFCLHCLFSKW